MLPAQFLVVKTKLNRPALPRKNLVPRTRLLEYLENSREIPFILVSAPAGYGKTTLINSYLETVNWPVAWLTLDTSDSNLNVFAQYFLKAIQSVFPGACSKASRLLVSTGLPPAEILAGILADEIDEIDRDFFLVLDDYSEIHEMEVHDLLSGILRHPPRHLHLIAITRRDPPLPLITLRAKQKMAEIRTLDLRFSNSETANLVRQLSGNDVTDQTIAIIQEKTSGWVTGIYLIASSLRNDDFNLALNSPLNNVESIHEYLLNEVFSRVPGSIQDLLLRLSILDRFCGSLVDVMAHNDNSSGPLISGDQYVEWLRKENLFLISLDKEVKWYEFHRLFRELLCHQLGIRYNSDDISRLHSKAGIWFSQNELYEEALKHTLAAGEIKLGIQMVARFNRKLKLPGQWQELKRLINLFPPPVIESSPDLLLAEACVMYARFQIGKMPQILDKVERLLSDIELEPARKKILQSEIAALRSYIYFWVGDYQNSLIQGRKALAGLPEDWHYIRESTQNNIAEAMKMLGNESSYVALINQWDKLNINLITSTSNNLNEQIRLCMIHWTNADLASLKSVSDNILSSSSDSNFEVYAGIGHYFQGLVYYYQNDLAQAEKHFIETMEKRYLTNILFVIQSAFALAIIYRALGQIQKAEDVINTAVAYLAEMNDTGLMSVVQAFQAELAVSQNDLATADLWANGFDPGPIPPMLTFYYPHFTLVRILLAHDKEESRRQAADILMRLRNCVESTHNQIFLLKVLISEALLGKSAGDDSAALAALKEALYLAKTSRIVRPFMEIGDGISDLFQYLDSNNDLFVRQIRNALADEISFAAGANSKLVAPLTDREIKVIGLLSRRLTNKEIASQLVISTGTVKSHTIRIYQKLNVQNRREATEKALSLGIIKSSL